MCLKKVELSGFKSFADPVEMTFEKPISAIVGPNGSGKSNVTEALRFVLGEQSVKSMRGEKTEDLIFNGGRTGKKLNRARVSVHLHNRNGLFDVPHEHVVIERVVHRDGNSAYKINGSVVRLKDVRNLLAFSSVSSKNHHIVSQGEADRLLYAKPEERKRIVEDALGLEGYILKIEESETKRKGLQEKKKQVREQVTVARRESNELEKLCSKRETGIAKMKELKQTAIQYAKKIEEVYSATHTKLKDRIEEVEIELEKETREIEEIKNQRVKVTTLNYHVYKKN